MKNKIVYVVEVMNKGYKWEKWCVVSLYGTAIMVRDHLRSRNVYKDVRIETLELDNTHLKISDFDFED
jgi:hypothetical protein